MDSNLLHCVNVLLALVEHGVFRRLHDWLPTFFVIKKFIHTAALNTC